MNQKDGDNSEWENMESLERREPISLLKILEEQNPNAERAARSTKVSLRKVGTREEKGMGAWAAPREDELGKVRYKPEELGLYIDDPHATLKPELQRHQIYNLASSD